MVNILMQTMNQADGIFVRKINKTVLNCHFPNSPLMRPIMSIFSILFSLEFCDVSMQFGLVLAWRLLMWSPFVGHLDDDDCCSLKFRASLVSLSAFHCESFYSDEPQILFNSPQYKPKFSNSLFFVQCVLQFSIFVYFCVFFFLNLKSHPVQLVSHQ